MVYRCEEYKSGACNRFKLMNDAGGGWCDKLYDSVCAKHATPYNRPLETRTVRTPDTHDMIEEILAWYSDMSTPPELDKFDNLWRLWNQYKTEQANLKELGQSQSVTVISISDSDEPK